MRTRMIFQYLAPGSKQPDAVTVSETMVEMEPGDSPPNVGDIVTIQPKSPGEELVNFESYKVVTRNFWYSYGGLDLNEIIDCQIFVIISEPGEQDITDIDM